MRGTRSRKLALCGLLLAATGPGCKEAEHDGWTIDGEIVAADDQQGVPDLNVIAPDGRKTTTAADGSFRFSGVKQRGNLSVDGEQAAPITKPAPHQTAKVSLKVKRFDASKELPASDGGTLKAPARGAAVVLGPSKLVDADGQQVTERVKLSIAVPDPRKRDEVGSISGDFRADDGSKAGKISAESPIFIEARGSTSKRRHALAEGQTMTLELSARVDLDRAEVQLWKLEGDGGRWVQGPKAQRALSEDGSQVYRAEIKTLGWWAIADFYDQLTCVRACARDPRGAPLASVQAAALGVDYFGEELGYTDPDGCFALEVKPDSNVLLEVADGITKRSLMVNTGAAGGDVSDPTSCLDVGELPAPVEGEPLDAGTGDAATTDAATPDVPDAAVTADGGHAGDGGATVEPMQPDGGAPMSMGDGGALPQQVPVGSPCMDNSQCGAMGACVPPGEGITGYCSRACTTDAECDGGNPCGVVPNGFPITGQACLLACNPASCATGFTCEPLEDVTHGAFDACMPTIVDDLATPGHERPGEVSCMGDEGTEVACTGSAPVCCATAQGTNSCVADDAGCTAIGGNVVSCDGAEDCSTGMICCARFDTINGTAWQACEPDCVPGAQIDAAIVCHTTDVECSGTGKICQRPSVQPWNGQCTLPPL